MATGRKARAAVDTTPGKILTLALLANAPIAVAFVLAPLASRGDATAALRFVPGVLFVTPLLAVLSLGLFVRAPRERKAHRASRLGLILSGTALLLWALVVAMAL